MYQLAKKLITKTKIPHAPYALLWRTVLDVGICRSSVLSCNTKYFINTNNLCEECEDSNCISCYGTNGGKCLTCDDGYNIDINL